MKKLAILSNIAKVSISVIGAIMLVGWLAAPQIWNKPLSYLATILLPYVPNFFNLIKIKFSLSLVLTYEVFLIAAMILGIDLNWYSEVLVMTDGTSYYDKIVHFSSGVLAAAVAQELFTLCFKASPQKLPKNPPKKSLNLKSSKSITSSQKILKPTTSHQKSLTQKLEFPPIPLWFQTFFLLGIVAIMTVGWECFEFFYDTICGGHMQELVKSGVADTMWDMIASLIGGSIYIFCLTQFPTSLKPDKAIDEK